MTLFISVTSQNGEVLVKKLNYQKILKFGENTPLFTFREENCVNECLRVCKKYGRHGDWNPLRPDFQPRSHPTPVIHKTTTARDLKSAPHKQFQERKKARTTQWKIFLPQIFFDGKL